MLATLEDGFRTAFSKKITWVALAAIPLICALFGLLYVATFTDPFSRFENMRVAIINLDDGAEVDGDHVNYGQELCDSILENESVLWVEEDPAVLETGLENTDYPVAVIIPRDFSQHVVAGKTAEPEQADITFFRNVRYNFMLATLSNRIETQLSEIVNEKVSAQYAEALAQGLYDAQDGMDDAAEGAGQLSQGIISLAEGESSALQGTSVFANGAATLASSVESASAATTKLSTGSTTLANGAETVAQGAHQTSSGASELAQGNAALAQGSAELNAGLATLSGNSSALADGWSGISSGIGTLSQGASALAAGSETYSSALSSQYEAVGGSSSQQAYESAYAAYAAAMGNLQEVLVQMQTDSTVAAQLPEAVANANDCAIALAEASGKKGASDALCAAIGGYAVISDGISQVNIGAANLEAGATSFESALQTYTGGVDAAAASSDKLASGAASATEGARTLASATSTLASGADTLQTGAAELNSGVSQLDQGMKTMANGASTLASGTGDLVAGLGELQTGTRRLLDGSQTLEEGLGDGSQEIGESLTASPEAYGTYISSPVGVVDDPYGDLPQFGHGFAPFFMTVCLWLCCLLLFFVFDPFPSYRQINAGRFAAVIGRWPLYLIMVALVATTVCAGSLMLGVPSTNLGMYIAHFAVVGVTFMLILQSFSLFDLPGKALAILILIMQICWSSGTLPAFLGSDVAQAVSPWLPFTYSIDAFREIISGGNMSTVFNDWLHLGCFALAGLALSLVAYPTARRLKLKRDQQQAAALSEAFPQPAP